MAASSSAMRRSRMLLIRHIGAIDHVSTLVEVPEIFAKLGERIGRGPAVAHKLLPD